MNSALAQTTNTAATVANETAAAVNMDASHAILSASLPVQLTLLILVVLSVLSWAIALSKKKQFDHIQLQNKRFLHSFWNSSSLEATFLILKNYPHSTLARLFASSYGEFKKLRSLLKNPKAKQGEDTSSDTSQTSVKKLMVSDISTWESSLDYLERTLTKAIDQEVPFLERHLNFLATTGSTAPFIGLFGTVWGIMGSFQKIASTNMASLAIVAPGISEALIATAIGLVTAIPATIFYNYFITKARKEEIALQSFATDFLNLTKRNIHKRHQIQ